MSETKKTDLSYLCPHCGQQAVIGQHFCASTTATEAKPGAPVKKASRNGWVYFVAATFLMVAVLWRWTGPASLLLAALALTGFFLWANRKARKGPQK